MKQLVTNLVALILLSTIIGCKKDFLNVDDNGQILRQEYVKDLKTTNEFLNGVYVVLAKDFYGANFQVYPDLVADNIKPKQGGATLMPHYKWQQTTVETNNLNFTWQTGYQLARSCSFVIERTTEYYDQDNVKAKRMLAQAYAIRALAHFAMVNVFSQSYNYTADASHPGIPYVTVSDWSAPVTRLTVGEVYSNILDDLNTAMSLYENTFSDVFYMNAVAAKALLARVYLFKGDYEKAKNWAVQVATAVPIMKGSDYPSKLFTKQNKEALFQLSPSSSLVLSGAYNTDFQGRYFTGTASQVQFLATQDIAQLLTQNPNDVRKGWIKSGGVGKDSIKKYPVNVVSGFNPVSQSYYPAVFRSSEMYLTAAEAYAMTGNETEARFYLDEIRKRADPSALASTATGTALLDSIYSERRKELVFEGLRMFDLMRWKKGVNRSDVSNSAPKVLAYPSNKAISPIPNNDVTVGISQNAGY